MSAFYKSKKNDSNRLVNITTKNGKHIFEDQI